jgi:hypothetical protein
MKQKLYILAALLVAQLLLAGVLAQRSNPLGARHASRPLATGLAAADRLQIEDGDGHQVVVQKSGKGWKLPGYHDTPVARGKVKQALAALEKVKLDDPVATSSQAAARFKTAKEKFERHLQLFQGERKLLDLYLGRAAGVSKSYLRLAGKQAVFQARLPQWDFPAEPKQWLDHELLRKEASNLRSLTVDGLVLTRHGKGEKAEWKADKGLSKGEVLDQKGVKRLLDALTALRVDEVLGTSPDKAWKLDRPERKLVLQSDGKPVTWLLARPEKGDFRVLKSSAHPWYFRLESWNFQPLLDASKREALVKKKPAG